MAFLATLITFTMFLIECFFVLDPFFTLDLMVISRFPTFLIEIISAEVVGFLMTFIILEGYSFPRVFFFPGFSLGWGYGR